MILMEIFSYVIDALLIYVFYDKYFSKERRREFASMAVIWGAFAMMEGINYVFNTMAPYIAVNMLVSVLGLFAMTLLYDAKVAKRIVAVVVFQVTAIVSEIFANVIFLVVPEKYFQDIDVLGMFISKLFLLVFLMILMLLQKKQKNIPTHYLITYFAIPIACIFVLCVLYRKSMYIDYISYIATGCIMLLNIVSYYLLDELSDYIIRASKVFQLNNQLETQKEKYEQLSTAFRSGNRLLHDTNKHLRYIGAKLQSDDAQGAMDYIERISGTLQETYGSICTGNLAVDSILSNMKTRLQEMNIPCYLTVNIEEARMRDIPEYDLVTIIGNITDNQMKAVPLVTDRDKRYVLFELEMLDNTIRIFAKNGMPPQQPVKMPHEDWFHGVGLHNVRETLERHGGALVTEVQDDFFLTMGVLPLGEGRKAVYYKGVPGRE